MEDVVKAVVDEWNKMTPRKKAELYSEYPVLYFLVARLVRTAEIRKP